jgi:hypothetical protein
MNDNSYSIRHFHYDYLLQNPNSKQEYKQFNEIICAINKKIIDKALEGKKIIIPYLGRFLVQIQTTIAYVDSEGKYKRLINLRKSRDKKKEILAKGGIVKSKDNPNGEDCIVFHDRHLFIYRLQYHSKNITRKYLKYFNYDTSLYAEQAKANASRNEEDYKKGLGIYEYKKVFDKRNISKNL